MARLRSKEAAARDTFRSAVERYIPPAVLSSLGLATVPPHCVVSVPQPDAGLAAVTPEDLKRAPAPQQVTFLAQVAGLLKASKHIRRCARRGEGPSAAARC